MGTNGWPGSLRISAFRIILPPLQVLEESLQNDEENHLSWSHQSHRTFDLHKMTPVKHEAVEVRSVQQNNRFTKVQHCWNYIGRLLWAGLFLIHIVPLLTVGSKLAAHPNLNLFLSLTAILGIMSIALLKAIDARALRFQLNSQKWCTLIVLGLFFHGDVVAKQLPDIMVAESTMVVLVTIVCASRRLQNLILKRIVSTSLQIREILYSRLEELAPTPLIPVYALLSSPRPPPGAIDFL